MSLLKLLKIIFILVIHFSCIGITSAQSTENTLARPNIVVILADDSGYADFGFQGSKEFLTPHLDKLAAEGVVFKNAYVSSAVCSPSRAGLLTGRYPNRMGIEFNLPGDPQSGIPGHQRGLPDFEKTLGTLLRQAGYATAYVGKWHLGSHQNFHPLNRGYEEFYGFLRGYSPYKSGKAKNILHNHQRIKRDNIPYLTDSFGNQAVEYITQPRDRPFYLQLSFNAPHPPLQALVKDEELFSVRIPTKTRARNAAMVYRMDANIGRLVDALESIGQRDNTLIIFTNDNGGSVQNGASNAPLRGHKGTLLEGGIKVPMLMFWTGGITAGQSHTGLTSTLDIVPTVAEAAGISLPEDRVFDGVSLFNRLDSNVVSASERTLYWRVNWASAIRHGDFKLINLPNQETWLFDLKQDPGETINIAPSHHTVTMQLKQKLVQWEKTVLRPGWRAHLKWKQKTLNSYHH